MVVVLGPGKFYGSGLPRPRFYTDVKFGPDRVDPPAPVMDPLLSWASEAHWSMGGLSFKRLRLQGRIEGNIERLRVQHRRSDRINKKKINNKKPAARPGNAADKIRDLDEEPEWQESPRSESEPEPEPEPVKVGAPAKEGKAKLKKRARKLVDEFEQVADRVGYRTRSKKPGCDKVAEVKGTPTRRTSPRKSLA